MAGTALAGLRNPVVSRPPIPDDVRVEAARRHIEAYATVTGLAFVPDTEDPDLCICTADISTCPKTTDPVYCCCSAEDSGCYATWIHGGCDTSGGCITG